MPVCTRRKFILHQITQFIITITQKWWLVALVFALNFASFTILFALEDQFEIITGVPVYDTQNDLTPEVLRAQLPLYTGEALTAYQRFAAYDFIFPLVAGIFLTVLWTLLLRLNTWQFPQRLLAWNFALFPLIGTFWDWLENVSLLTVLSAAPTPSPAWIDAAIVFKRLKLLWLSTNGAISGVLVVLLVANVLYRVTRRR